ncbi:hypothetical protein [Sutcliffiella rhizosphaerae]|uniref:Holin n=1 Tax=Sutcliffiella rhizosphaerae TaxID=2880967 RepID=A0ABM8YR66_9BACI|nr:hypothetical protein [Sutcliffiella rhizosphaerae]CAG9622326.1 hypothetical protein BACCIP111883_03117 [Sutcliffiella rhizosphaerae]
METLPIIHTNIWDALYAVPLTLLLTELIKKLTPISKAWIPTTANIIGLLLSVFIAHRGNVWSGIFMGFFYGNAAVGLYASLKNTFTIYRNKE